MIDFVKRIFAAAMIFAIALAVIAVIPSAEGRSVRNAPFNARVESERVVQIGNFESNTPIETFGRVKFKVGATELTRPVVAKNFYSGAKFNFAKGTKIHGADGFETILLPPQRKTVVSFANPKLPSGKFASIYVSQIGSLSQKYSQKVAVEIPVNDVLKKYTAQQIAMLIFDQSSKNWREKTFAFDADKKTVSFKIDESTVIAFYEKGTFQIPKFVELKNETAPTEGEDLCDVAKLNAAGAEIDAAYFFPNQKVTRGFAIPTVLQSFQILDSGNYFDFARKAEGLNIATKNLHLQDESLRKIEALALILKASGLSLQSETKFTFDDIDSNSWQGDYINFAAENGIIDISSNKFYPRSAITRCEFTEMISKTLEIK